MGTPDNFNCLIILFVANIWHKIHDNNELSQYTLTLFNSEILIHEYIEYRSKINTFYPYMRFFSIKATII